MNEKTKGVKRTIPLFSFNGSDSHFRTAKIETDGFYILPLFNSNPATVQECRTIAQIKNAYESRYGLLLAVNGTYTGTEDGDRRPLGDVWGRSWTANNARKWQRWNQPGYVQIHKRWYFAIRKNGVPEIKHPIAGPVGFDQDAGYDHNAATEDQIRSEFRMILQGGLLLFNRTYLLPDTLQAFIDQFNLINDLFQEATCSAYFQIGHGRPDALWGIGICESGKHIVIVSSGQGLESQTSGLPVYELAQKIKALEVDGQKVMEAIVFDGRSPHTLWAAESVDQPMPAGPQAVSAADGKYYNTNYLAVFFVPRVQLLQIGSVYVPQNYSLHDPALEITLIVLNPFTIQARVYKSFKPTKKVELLIMNRRTYTTKYMAEQEVPLDDFLGHTWLPPQGADDFGDQVLTPVILKDSYKNKLIKLAVADTGKLTCVIRSLDRNGKTISEQAVPILLQFQNSFKYIFLLDNWGKKSRDLQPVRDAAVRQLTARIFEDAASSRTGLDPAVQARIRIKGYSTVACGVPGRWSASLEEVTGQLSMMIFFNLHGVSYETHIQSAVRDFCAEPLSFRTLFFFVLNSHTTMEGPFPPDPWPAGTKQDLSPPHVPGESAKPLIEIDQLAAAWAAEGIVIHCIGFGNAVDAPRLQLMAEITGGICSFVNNSAEIASAFLKAYEYDRATGLIMDCSRKLIPGQPLLENVFLSANKRGLFRLRWSDPNTQLRISLTAPDGAIFSLQNKKGPQWVYGKGYAVLTIPDTTPYLTGPDPWRITGSDPDAKSNSETTVRFLISESNIPETSGPVPEPPPAQAENYACWYCEWEPLPNNIPPGWVNLRRRDPLNFSATWFTIRYPGLMPGPRAVAGDPRSGHFWFAYGLGGDLGYRLAEITPEGKMNEKPLSKMEVQDLCLDDSRHRIWLGGANQVRTVNTQTWETSAIPVPFPQFNYSYFALDRERDYVLACLYIRPGIFRFDVHGTSRFFNESALNPQFLKILANGEVVCLTTVKQTHKVIRLNLKGQIVAESVPLSMSVEDLIIDEREMKIWLYSHYLVCCLDSNLKILFTVTEQNTGLKELHIDSLALNFKTRSVILAGRMKTSAKQVFVADMDSAGKLSKIITAPFEYNRIFTCRLQA